MGFNPQQCSQSSGDSRHADPGCYHTLSCSRFTTIVNQASQDMLWSSTFIVLCGQTQNASLSGFTRGKSKATSESWSVKLAHIFVQSWRLSTAFYMLLLPWKTLWDVPIAPVAPLPHAELFSSEENEKVNKWVCWKYCLWSSSRRCISGNWYDTNFIVKVCKSMKFTVKKSMPLKKLFLIYY